MDGSDGNGLQLEKIRLNFSSSFHLPLNVQTQCWAWIKLATDNFSTVLTKNLRNPRDYAPLKQPGSFNPGE